MRQQFQNLFTLARGGLDGRDVAEPRDPAGEGAGRICKGAKAQVVGRPIWGVDFAFHPAFVGGRDMEHLDDVRHRPAHRIWRVQAAEQVLGRGVGDQDAAAGVRDQGGVGQTVQRVGHESAQVAQVAHRLVHQGHLAADDVVRGERQRRRGLRQDAGLLGQGA